MKFTKYFFSEKREILLSYLIISLIYFLCFSLFSLPVLVVLYPFMISLILFIIYLGFSFFRERENYRAYQYFKVDPLSEEKLPGTTCGEKKELAEIIYGLQKRVRTEERVAKKKQEEFTDYTRTWVHQVKTPITAMSLLLQNEDSDFSRELNLNLFRIDQYTEMILRYFSLEDPSTDYVFTRTNLERIVKDQIVKFAPEFIRRHLAVELGNLHYSFVTDSKWLSFVIGQLLSNALKYTNEGKLKIKMKGTDLVIKDTGIGIPPEDIPRIFEKGFTGQNGRISASSSGLGLYLVKRTCENLEIPIRIKSTPGKGTTVILSLEQNQILQD